MTIFSVLKELCLLYGYNPYEEVRTISGLKKIKELTETELLTNFRYYLLRYCRKQSVTDFIRLVRSAPYEQPLLHGLYLESLKRASNKPTNGRVYINQTLFFEFEKYDDINPVIDILQSSYNHLNMYTRISGGAIQYAQMPDDYLLNAYFELALRDAFPTEDLLNYIDIEYVRAIDPVVDALC